MKRFIGALLLLGLVVAVSYLKTVWDEYRQQGWVEEQMAQTQGEIDSLTRIIDSLQDATESSQKRLFSMMARQQETYAASADSLRIQIANQQEVIAGLTSKLSGANQRLASLKVKASKKPSGISHAEVLGYYQGRVSKLPNDLSAYERKVAVGEVREETARRFSITLSKVDEIVGESATD